MALIAAREAHRHDVLNGGWGGVAGYAGLVYASSGFIVMWGFWTCFVVFLANPSRLPAYWPLPTVDRGGSVQEPWGAALIHVGLIALFGLQHSLMARPWFKDWWAASVPPAFERSTYVHMANAALFALIIFWQPIPIELWRVSPGPLRDGLWALFGLGWIILFAGAWSFGLRDLLGLDQMRRWRHGLPPPPPRLHTGFLYGWLRHPMYVGVLLGVWATPTMTAGHALLACGLTAYVGIAMRYEERDLARRFGATYRCWRGRLR